MPAQTQVIPAAQGNTKEANPEKQGILDFSRLPAEVVNSVWAPFLDHRTLVAYAISHKAALQLILPELERRVAFYDVKVLWLDRYPLLVAPNGVYKDQWVNYKSVYLQLLPITATLKQAMATEASALMFINNSLYAYGINTFGKLGLGDTLSSNDLSPVAVSLGSIQQIILSDATSFLITNLGVYACGSNSLYGQLGLGDNRNRNRFTLVNDIPGNIKQVAAARFYTFILTDTGLYACGDNHHGQLGLGDNEPRNRFTLVPGIKGRIKNVIVGNNSSFIITETQVYACGLNDYGQLAVGDNQARNRFTPMTDIAGTVQQIIIDNALSHPPRFFIVTDKALYACGSNFYGELGLGEPSLVNDKNSLGTCVAIHHYAPVIGITGVIQQIAMGEKHTLIITTTGLYACGYNDDGQLGLNGLRDRYYFERVMTGTVLAAKAFKESSAILTPDGVYECGYIHERMLTFKLALKIPDDVKLSLTYCSRFSRLMQRSMAFKQTLFRPAETPPDSEDSHQQTQLDTTSMTPHPFLGLVTKNM